MADTEPNPHAARGVYFAAAVYGSIVAASLIGAFYEEGASSETTAVSLISTLGVFWLAHVWSETVGERIELGRTFTWPHLAEIAREEWPLIEAAVAPGVILLAGWAGLLSDHHALRIALTLSELQLFGWGFIVGRRAYSTLPMALGTGLLNGALGIGLVALERAVVHH